MTEVTDIRYASDQNVVERIKIIASRAGCSPILFFGGDPDITSTAKLWPQLQEHVVPVTDPIAAERYNDKAEQLRCVRAAGVRVPESGVVRTLAELETLAPSLSFPAIARPVALTQRGTFQGKVIIATDANELSRRLAGTLSDGHSTILVQEYVPGGDRNLLFALADCDDNGQVNALVTGRKLRQYPQGLMCEGEAVRLPSMADSASRSFSALKLGGVLGVEFKQHPETEELFYIEANFRPENILSVSTAAGVNIMMTAYLSKLGYRHLMAAPCQQSAVWRDYSMIALGRMAGTVKRPRGHPSAHQLDQLPRMAGAVWARDDPLPALGWWASKVDRAGRKIAISLWRRVSGRGRAPERPEEMY